MGFSALALAACGSEERRAVPGPRLDADVAGPLATRSDEVARLLEAGNACGARAQATLLRTELTRAINERAIPEPYLEELSGAVNEIEAQIPPCKPMIPPPRKQDDDEDVRDD